MCAFCNDLFYLADWELRFKRCEVSLHILRSAHGEDIRLPHGFMDWILHKYTWYLWQLVVGMFVTSFKRRALFLENLFPQNANYLGINFQRTSVKSFGSHGDNRHVGELLLCASVSWNNSAKMTNTKQGRLSTWNSRCHPCSGKKGWSPRRRWRDSFTPLRQSRVA